MHVARRLAVLFAVGITILVVSCGSPLNPLHPGEQGPSPTRAVLASAPASQVAFPLKLSADKRRLVDQNGAPFLIKEASSWGLIQSLSEADAAVYMDSLLAKGFNTLLVSVISYDTRMAGGPPNWQGIPPFTTQWDFSTYNDAYFAHADRVLNMARDRGMLVLLVACYLGYAGDANQGWWNELLSSTNSVAKSQAYGRYLGNRYKDFGNIVWVAGGDNTPSPGSELENRLFAIMQGIKENDTHLWTAHWNSPSWSTDQARFAPYMDIDGWYAYTESSPQYLGELTHYNASSRRMIFQLDQSYETEPQGDPATIRRKNYDGLLSGCAGTSFCAGPDWYLFYNWRNAMDTTGTEEAFFAFKLFDSRAWQDLVPDQNSAAVTAGRGTYGSADYVCAARTASGGTLMAYLPSSRAVTVTMTAISGTQANAWWYNPRSGQATLIGTYPTTGSRTYTPASGDWVLVVDDASLNLPAPGSANQGPQVLTTVSVTPASASVAVGAQQQFLAVGLDQSGAPMAPQPAFAWTVSGGGVIDGANGLFTAGGSAGGPFSVTASAGALSGTATVSVTSGASIIMGEASVLPLDDYGNANLLLAQKATLSQAATVQSLSFYVTTASGKLRLGIYDASGPGGGPGSLEAQTAEITPTTGWNTAGVTAPVSLPAGTYWLTYLTSSDSLHFRRAGSGTYVMGSYAYAALPSAFPASPSSGADHWSFYATLQTGPVQLNQPPTVAAPASAAPVSVTGTTTNLGVLGADDGGEAGLTYTWATAGTAPAPVAFSANGTNAAKSATATFAKAGAYGLQVTLKDEGNLTATSAVSVTVTQSLSAVGVTPSSAAVAANATQQFAAIARDQFGSPMSPQPAFAWTVSGGGTIDGASGLFTAGGSAGGPFSVTASTGGLSGTATVAVSALAPITMGEASILRRDDNGNANLLLAQKATLSQTATIQSLSFYVAAASGKLRLGVYDASGPGGGPGSLKAQTGEITPTTGWNSAGVTAPVSLPAGTYWLAYLTSSNSLHFRRAGSGAYKMSSYAYGALPSAFPASPSSGSDHWSFYGTLLP